MSAVWKFVGIAFTILGLYVLLIVGKESGIIPGIIFTLSGIGVLIYFNFAKDISKKRARKELIELKSMLDSGVLNQQEYEEKSKILKSKI